MLRFCLYLVLCLLFMFLDFYIDIRGILVLTFDVVVVSILLAKHLPRKEKSVRYYDFNIFYGIIIIILSLVFKEMLFRYFKYAPIKYYNQIDLFFIVSIIIKSFTEEVIFRGYWLTYFLGKYSKKTSILIVSFGFAFLHLFARNDPVFAFFASLILSYIYIKRQSIFTTFMIHITINFFTIFLLPIIIDYYTTLEVKNKIKIILLVFLVLIYFLKLLLKKSDQDQK